MTYSAFTCESRLIDYFTFAVIDTLKMKVKWKNLGITERQDGIENPRRIIMTPRVGISSVRSVG